MYGMSIAICGKPFHTVNKHTYMPILLPVFFILVFIKIEYDERKLNKKAFTPRFRVIYKARC